jgi:predicted small lipoprotein YifL
VPSSQQVLVVLVSCETKGVRVVKKSLKPAVTAAFATTAVLLPVLALAACGAPAAVSLPPAGQAPVRHAAPPAHHRESASKSAATTQVQTTTTTAVVGRCLKSQLVAWLAVPRTGFTNESNIYDLQLSNISSHACTLYGYPGVSATGPGGKLLGSAAGRAGGLEFLVTLAPGGSAHAILYVAYKGDFPASTCKPVVASGLRVFAPGAYSALGFPYSFPACSRRGPVYLSVSPVAAGVGIPGAGN